MVGPVVGQRKPPHENPLAVDRKASVRRDRHAAEARFETHFVARRTLFHAHPDRIERRVGEAPEPGILQREGHRNGFAVGFYPLFPAEGRRAVGCEKFRGQAACGSGGSGQMHLQLALHAVGRNHAGPHDDAVRTVVAGV